MEEEEDDAFVIVQHVQAILETVTAEFAAARATMTDGRWSGLDAEARKRVATRTREEVSQVQLAFERARVKLEGFKGKDASKQELHRALVAEAAEAERLEAMLARLETGAPGAAAADVAMR